MIIKVLIALVLLMVIFLAFRIFFGAEAPIVSAAPSLDTAQLEKTLQKILDAQAKTPVFAVPTEGPAAASNDALMVAGASSAATIAELEKLKRALVEKENLLTKARQDAARAASIAASSSAGEASGKSSESAAKFETKIKDLEARLAEYEIISEDIADLSFYKEENIRLQTELTAQKTGGGTPTGGVPDSSGGASVADEPATSGSVKKVDSAETTAMANLSTAPDAVAEVSSADEDLMKEFEKAVQEQKGPVAGPKIEASDSVENSQLMNQFENFVKKS